MLHESPRPGGRQNTAVTEHRGGVSVSGAGRWQRIQQVKRRSATAAWRATGAEEPADGRRGNAAKPSLNTRQLPLAGAWTHAHNLSLSRPLYTCRLVTEIRGGPEQNPVVHLSGSPRYTPTPLAQPPLAAILWSFKSRRWSLNRDRNTGAASSNEEPAKKERIWNKKKRKK